MVDKAKVWATNKGLSRTNQIHGEQEYRVPTQSNFSFSDKETIRTKLSAKTTLEAGPAFDKDFM